jgi:hypothetical protein
MLFDLCLTISLSTCKISPAQLKERFQAEIAQLVEHTTENCGVASSILALGTLGLIERPPAGVVQW